MATPPAPKRLKKTTSGQPAPSANAKGKPATSGKVKTKIFVLDTCVLLFDHTALKNFEDNKVALPITVLEELDRFKVGNESKHFEARACIRALDKLIQDHAVHEWVPLDNGQNGALKIVMDHSCAGAITDTVFSERTNDHKILDAALCLQAQEPDSKVVLVSKDINLRLKAKALNLPAEDYQTGKVKDNRHMFTGKTTLENIDCDVIRRMHVDGQSRKVSALGDARENNHFYVLKDGSASAMGYFNEQKRAITRVDKTYAFGIKPRNAEQAFALHAIQNPDVNLVTVCGVAGTGKTLLALAGALEQHKRYDQIILARPIVALSNKDLGFLPGDAEEKINPYMQPLFDNLKFIQGQFGPNERKYRLIEDMKKDGKITISPLAYIRGRSLSNVVFIVDEAQNLTPHEVKTIVTRAGENTKIILTGDIRQIDTPYLDEQSNGLTYLIDRLRGKDLYCHITLEKGERSALANLANDHL